MTDFLRSFVRKKALSKIFEEKREEEEEGTHDDDDEEYYSDAGEEHFEEAGNGETHVNEGLDDNNDDDEDGENQEEEEESSSVVIHEDSVTVTSASMANTEATLDEEICGDSGVCSNGSDNEAEKKPKQSSRGRTRESSKLNKEENSLATPDVDDRDTTLVPDREKTPSPSTGSSGEQHRHRLSTTTSTPALKPRRSTGSKKHHQRSVSDVVGYEFVLGHTSPSDDSDDNNSNHLRTNSTSDNDIPIASVKKRRAFGSVDATNFRFELGDTSTGYEDSYDEEEEEGLHKHTDMYDEEEDEMDNLFPQMEGFLAKWTNYFHGWQERYFVLQKGNLSYFKSKEDTTKVCRGTMDLSHAKITPHPYDVLRFDVVLRDQAFCIRTSSTVERAEWVLAMKESQKLQSGGGLSRQPSTLSLTSIASGTSNHHTPQSVYRQFTDKYTEARALHEAFINQIEGMNLQLLEGANARDMQRQNALLKSTSSGLIRSLKEWMDLMSKREEEWRRKYDRVNDRRRRAVEELRVLKEQRGPPLLGPDMEEGPHSTMNEEEFFDALELGLDQLDAAEEETRRERELEEQRGALKPAEDAASHRFSSFIDDKLKENLALALEPVDEVWSLTYQEDSMKVYTRESDETNQQKCFHTIKGITAKELCSFYWDHTIRLEWEHTIEKLFVLEWLDKSSCIQHNIHKRVWPTAQRDSCMLSHLRQFNDKTWLVQNISVNHDDAPTNKYVRLDANILLHATTVFPENIPKDKLKREDVSTNVVFLAYIHPGGWAPVSVVKAVSRREYPKFLKNLEQYSLKHYKNSALGF